MLNTARNIISSDATTQQMIAPVIDTLVATKNYSIGEEFIYVGTLYKVISVISVGDTIVLGSGGNADTAETVTEQIRRYSERGLKKASSWEDAKTKATSYVLVKMYGVMGNPIRIFTLIIPKEDFSSASYFTTGFYYNATNNALITFRPITEGTTVYYNGVDVSNTFTTEFYYDN